MKRQNSPTVGPEVGALSGESGSQNTEYRNEK